MSETERIKRPPGPRKARLQYLRDYNRRMKELRRRLSGEDMETPYNAGHMPRANFQDPLDVEDFD